MKWQLWLAFAWVALMLPGAAWAQSDVVFMTADDFDLVPSPQSRLYRFDGGVQSYSVDTGAAAVFQGVTILNREVLVADYLAEAIQRFSPSGTYLGPFASVLDPSFLETDAAGNVYVTTLDGLAMRLNSSGTVTQNFGLGGALGIDADASGNVYIAQNAGGANPDRIMKFAPNGSFLGSVTLNVYSVQDLAIDEVGQRLFITDTSSSVGILIFDISGPSPTFVSGITSPGSVLSGVHYAKESGHILAAEFAHLLLETPRGLRFSSSGDLLNIYLPIGAEFGWDITTLAPIPEPASVVLALMAAAAFWGRGRRPY